MHTVLSYVFPLLLLVFEWGLRIVLKQDASGFFGPTLAAAALTCLIPLTKPVEKSYGVIRSRGVVVTTRFDSNFIIITWLLVIVCLFAWAAACYFSLVTPEDRILGLSTHSTIGGAAYATSLLMTSLKEKS